MDAVFAKKKPDVVFHLAGAMQFRRPITDPLFSEDVSFLSRTQIILEACKKHGVKKIIFISSGGAVYGNANVVPTSEEYPASPDSLYGMANLMMEKYIALYCSNYGIDFAIPRVSNAYGPRQWQTGFIPALINSLLKKENLVMHSNGRQTRDFIYIDDLVEALLLLANKGKNEIYNVGSGKELQLQDILAITEELMESKISIVRHEQKSLEVERSALDVSKIQKELGWKPKTDFEAGLQKTIEYFKNAKS